MNTSKEYIENQIGHLRKPFIIEQDGSSQTMHDNTGRVGFFIERNFGILPNNDRSPDLGSWELKTTRPGKKISIGTMPESEHRKIVTSDEYSFFDSEPYKKMKNTLFVVYDKLTDYPQPEYVMLGWAMCKLDLLSDYVKKELDSDYRFICKQIKRYSTTRDNLTAHLRQCGTISGDYLTLSYKGSGYCGYNYPAWSFKGSFIKQIIKHA